MKTYKRGISLIVLVITIIVLAILATTVIVSLSNTNIIKQATDAAFRNDMASYKEAYALYLADYMMKNNGESPIGLNAKYGDVTFTNIFGDNVSEKYRAGLEIKNGKLVYNSTNETEKEILEELGMAAVNIKIGDVVAYTPTADPNATFDYTHAPDYVNTTTSHKPGVLEWVYMGKNEQGNILLTSSKPTTFQIAPYKNAVSVIDSLCDSMYGNSTYGIARNMKLEDIDRLVGYNGCKHMEWDYLNNVFIEYETEIGYYEYELLDYITVNSNEYKLLTQKADNVESNTYLLTTENGIGFYYGSDDEIPDIYFYRFSLVNISENGKISYCEVAFDGSYQEGMGEHSLRPVVVLNSNVSIGDLDSNGAWTLVLN